MGLLRMATRTAVVAGTAGADVLLHRVGVSRRRGAVMHLAVLIDPLVEALRDRTGGYRQYAERHEENACHHLFRP